MKRKWIADFLIAFLLLFMWLIFGPMEIFMGNISQFSFGYGDFIFIMSAIAIVAAIVITVILGLLPEGGGRIVRSLLFAISLGSYVQIMFLNTNLDLLGVTPEANEFKKRDFAKNTLVWGGIFLIVFLVYRFKKAELDKIICAGAGFLLAVQMVGFFSLIVTSDGEDFHKSYDDVWYITGEQQFEVSSGSNVIVLIFDYFSNQYLEPMLEQYPEALDYLQDFTYYDNTDCVYYGTFPSLAHLITGQELDFDIAVNDWFTQIWSDDMTQQFYQSLKNNDYSCRVYTDDSKYLCGTNSVQLLEGSIDNLAHATFDTQLDYVLLLKTMTKMSAYRMAPYGMKTLFYTSMSEYTDIVAKSNETAVHQNGDFYDRLIEDGLTVSDAGNSYIVQHLMGAHEYKTAADGTEKVGATLEETASGCMAIAAEYLNQLKELGVYDDATIIITSDHGGPRDSQPIFFMKKANEHHEEMEVNSAPTSFLDFQATIAKAAGLDYEQYGTPFDEISEEPRERTQYVRAYNKDYPKVKEYDSEKNSTLNVYSAYTYIGNVEDLMKLYDEGPTDVIPMYDSFY